MRSGACEAVTYIPTYDGAALVEKVLNVVESVADMFWVGPVFVIGEMRVMGMQTDSNLLVGGRHPQAVLNGR